MSGTCFVPCVVPRLGEPGLIGITLVARPVVWSMTVVASGTVVTARAVAVVAAAAASRGLSASASVSRVVLSTASASVVGVAEELGFREVGVVHETIDDLARVEVCALVERGGCKCSGDFLSEFAR